MEAIDGAAAVARSALRRWDEAYDALALELKADLAAQVAKLRPPQGAAQGQSAWSWSRLGFLQWLGRLEVMAGGWRRSR